MSRIKRVHSFSELATTPFADGINALCWERTLPGDFAAVVALLSRRASVLQTPSENEGLTSINLETLERLLALLAPSDRSTCILQPSTRAAIQFLLEDLRSLREIQRDPVLNLIHGYPRDDGGGPVPTDVFSFHVDSAPIAADTWLCTYHGPPSEGLRNEDAVRKVDVPAIRAELLKIFGGNDDESFAEFLHENHYDLHFAPAAPSVPGLSTFTLRLPTAAASAAYSFGLFNLWRIACDYPGSPVPPCVHRAPTTKPDDAPRLLLIS